MKTTQHVTSYKPQRNGKMIDNNLLREMHVIVPCAAGDPDYSGSGMKELIFVRIHGTNAMNRVSLWVHGNNGCAGHGKAGGYGYHRVSAAMQDALESAGIELASRIDGVGDSAMRDALEAVAAHLGYSKCLIVG